MIKTTYEKKKNRVELLLFGSSFKGLDKEDNDGFISSTSSSFTISADKGVIDEDDNEGLTIIGCDFDIEFPLERRRSLEEEDELWLSEVTDDLMRKLNKKEKDY